MKLKRPLLIIKAGSTFPELIATAGDFDDWIIRDLCLPETKIRVLSIFEGEHPNMIENYSGVIITGAHDMVTQRRDWSVRITEWISQNIIRDTGIPVLGICYGHQLLAEALGGKAGFHPGGREIGSVGINLSKEGQKDELTKILPSRFLGQVTHRQSALELPENAVILASNDHELHHAVRFRPGVWGVQFHPEFDEKAMHWYFKVQLEILQSEGLDVKEIETGIGKTQESAQLLKRFAEIVCGYCLS